VLNNLRGTPVFLQNGPVFRPKTDPFLTRSLQVAFVVRVRQYEKRSRRGSDGGSRVNRCFRHGIDDGD